MIRHLFVRLGAFRAGRRFLVPEVVQTSPMDCGPASLASLLQGLGIPVDFDRLREACQTRLDGTSIDRIEEIAELIGLSTAQRVLPCETLFLRTTEVLPAIVLTTTPGGELHFVVVWRTLGPWVQIMDPQFGRRWLSVKTFQKRLYQHGALVPAQAWRDWACQPAFVAALSVGARRIGASAPTAERLVGLALADPDWRALALLDAALRMVGTLARSGGIARGKHAIRLLESLVARSLDQPDAAVVPNPFHSVQAAPGTTGHVVIRGIVALTIRRPSDPGSLRNTQSADPSTAAAILAPSSIGPPWSLPRLLRLVGHRRCLVITVGIAFGAAVTACVPILLQRILTLPEVLTLPEQRLAAAGMILAFLALVATTELALQSELSRAGRVLETGLRRQFLHAVSRLPLDFFGSRPVSDMAHRCHSLHRVRRFSHSLGASLRLSVTLVATLGGLLWLVPRLAVPAALLAAGAIALQFLVQRLVGERDLRFRTQSGVLTRFHLDALLGALPIRAHTAAGAVHIEHEACLLDWRRTGLQLLRLTVCHGALEMALAGGLAVLLISESVLATARRENFLLVAYWAMSLPLLLQGFGQALRQLPTLRNLVRRLLEPLRAAGDDPAPIRGDSVLLHPRFGAQPHGVAVDMRDVTVRIGGHQVLSDINLEIAPGSHVAILGASGSGKSSLVGILLGWRVPATGAVLVDGAPIEIDLLRRLTAWIDPAAHLWSGSLFENIRFGATTDDPDAVGQTVATAHLIPILQHLPDGMQTRLGENGALVSGGEGQRVRMARALMRPDARLVIMDEPFRGLDRAARRVLMTEARAVWRQSTLLCITHDVDETLSFDRVLVVHDGRIVEDGAPAALTRNPKSHLRSLLAAEADLRSRVWDQPDWRRWRLQAGTIAEAATVLPTARHTARESRDAVG